MKIWFLALWIVHRRWWQHLLFGLAVIIAIGRTGINKSITISRNAVEWYAEAYFEIFGHNYDFFANDETAFLGQIYLSNFSKGSIKPTSEPIAHNLPSRFEIIRINHFFKIQGLILESLPIFCVAKVIMAIGLGPSLHLKVSGPILS